MGDPDQPQPLFAVAMPACNAAATIDEALDSVLAQTFTAWELVVVDDGSTDDTRARAEAFAARDPRIRVVTQPNGGVGAARARAIAATTAPWIVNFDADDVLLPQCLATYARTMAQHPERHILSCDMEIFGPAVATHRRSDDRPLPTDQEFRLEDIIEGCWITNPASVISRQLYERIGGLRTDIYAEDYDLWLRALAHGGRHLLVPESLVRYRVSPTQQTAAASRSLAGAAEALRSLATSGLLDAAAADRCRLSAGRHDAMAREHERRRRGIAARQDLETRLRRGDMTNARRDLIRARHGYQSKAKLALAGSVFLASPRLYVAYLRHLRDTAMSPATALQEGGAPLTHSFADVTAHADASHPLFAIVMPACNAEETIAEALASVLAQTFSAWELVVVDDGSTDDTRARAEDFAARDPRIRVLRQPNAGPGAARNRAVAASSAPFIVCVDADDVLLPHCLATYAAVIRANPSHELFSCDMEVFDGEGELGLLYELAGQPYRAEVTLEDQLQANLIVGGAAVISRRLYRLLGGQKPRRHAEDYDLWLRALAHGGRHLMVPEALARYRRSPSQLSARSDLGYEATAAALRDLSTSGLLDRRLARSARASARRHERMARRDRARRQRTALELRLCDGNLRHARRDFLRALPAYDSRLKLALAGPVFLVCPRLYRLRVRHLLSCATGPTASTPAASQERDATEQQPTFSIIVPAYNSAATLTETLASVSAQTYASWEAIIVDDGSSDDTATIADSFAARDPRFCVLRQRHGGRSAARTAAMERSRGVYLCPLDADDVYLPEFLEEQHRFIADHPGFDVYSCNVDAWLPDGARTPYFREPEYAREMEIRLEDLLERNRFTILCVFRRRLYERLGGFAPTLDRLEDYEYWLRATAAGARIVHNPATLALYRQYPDSPTAYLHSDLPIQRRILVALIRSHRLTPAQRVRAWDSIRQTEAWTARFELERRLDNGRFCGVRRLLWRARSTYPVASKRALALAAVTISPQLFAALRAGRRHLARLQVKG